MAAGDLTFIDIDYQGGDYRGVWCDGNFIYTGCGGDGLRSYSVNSSGGLIPIDTDFNTISVQVYGDGSYIYVTCSSSGLMSYSVDGVGNLTFADKIKDSTFSFWNDVWADGTFVYTANSGSSGSGLRVYQSNGSGILSFISVNFQGGAGYFKVWGDGNFIYCACATSGLRSYSVDGGGNLTHRDVDDQGGTYFDVWGDGNFIYVTTTDGIRSYSVDGSGNLTFISLIGGDPGFQDSRIWGDGTFIYANSSSGIRSYSVDGSGNLSFIDTDGSGTWYGVWGDGNFIYTGGGATGIRSYQAEPSSSSSSSSSLSSSSSSSSLSSSSSSLSSSSSSSSLSSSSSSLSSSSSSLSSSSSSSSLSSSSSSLSSSSSESAITCNFGVHGLQKVDWGEFDPDVYTTPIPPSGYNKVVSNANWCEMLSYIADAAFPYSTDNKLIFKQIRIVEEGTESEVQYEAVWVPSAGLYYADIIHYMGVQYPYASTLWDEVTKQIIYPVEIEFIGTKELRIWVYPYSVPNDMTLVIASQGSLWSSSSSSTSSSSSSSSSSLSSSSSSSSLSSSSSSLSSSSSSSSSSLSSSSSSSSLSSSSSSLSSSSSSSSLSSSSSSSSSSLSSSSSSYSSNCAEDLLDIPFGGQPDYHIWSILQNDGGFGSGSGTTLRYNSLLYGTSTIYSTVYQSRWYFPAGSDWDINISWNLNYIEAPNSGYNLFSLRYTLVGVGPENGDWTEVRYGKGGANLGYDVWDHNGGSLSGFISSTPTPFSSGFRIRKVGGDSTFWMWDAVDSRWEWNGGTAGYNYLASNLYDIKIQLYFHTGSSHLPIGGLVRYLDVEMYDFEVTSYDAIVCGSSSSSSTSSSSSSLSSSSSSLSSSSSSSSSSLSSSSSSSSLSSSSSSLSSSSSSSSLSSSSSSSSLSSSSSSLSSSSSSSSVSSSSSSLSSSSSSSSLSSSSSSISSSSSSLSSSSSSTIPILSSSSSSLSSSSSSLSSSSSSLSSSSSSSSLSSSSSSISSSSSSLSSSSSSLSSSSSSVSSSSSSSSVSSSSSSSSISSSSSSSSSSISSSSSSSSVSSSSRSSSSSSSSCSYTPYEHLVEYTKVDSGGDITLSCTRADFNTIRKNAVSYVYKDFSASYFGNFKVEFEAEITASDSSAEVDLYITDTIGTREDTIDNNDGYTIIFWNDPGNLTIRIKDESNDNVDFYFHSGPTIGLTYFTFERNDTTLTLEIYSDAGRTILIDTLSVVCTTTSKRYLYAIAGRDFPGTETITGYTQNFEIIFNSSVSSSSSSSSVSSSSSSSSSSLSSSSSSVSSSSSPPVGEEWLDGFKNRQRIEIAAASIDADLVNFPVCLRLGASAGVGTTDLTPIFDNLLSDANRFKIAVTTSDGTTQCPVEIERWTHASEIATLHTKMPAVSSAGTSYLYLYYDVEADDNTAFIGDIDDAISKTVWDDNFLGVWHMASTSPVDSTVNINTGIEFGNPTLVDGLNYAWALQFDETDDVINCGNASTINDIPLLTVEGIFNPTSLGQADAGRLMDKATTGNSGWSLQMSTTGYAWQRDSSGGLGLWKIPVGRTTLGAWQHLAVTHDNTDINNDPILYEAGSAATLTEIGTPSGTWESDAGADFRIGKRVEGDREFHGKIGEVRMSDVIRAPSWLKATSLTLFDNFITWGDAESSSSSSSSVSSSSSSSSISSSSSSSSVSSSSSSSSSSISSSSSSSSISSSSSSSSVSSSSSSSSISSSSTSYEPYENLSAYTKVDSADDITIVPLKCTFTTMRRDAVSYVYYDYGAGYFGNFKIELEVKIDAGTQYGSVLLCGVANTLGTFQDLFDAVEGLLFWAYNNNNTLQFQMSDRENLPGLTCVVYGTSTNLLYVTFKRSGSTFTVDIFNDSTRETLVTNGHMSLTCTAGTKRYLYALASRDSDTTVADFQTGYTQNFEIIYASSSSSSISSSSSSISSSSSSISSSSSSISSSSTLP